MPDVRSMCDYFECEFDMVKWNHENIHGKRNAFMFCFYVWEMLMCFYPRDSKKNRNEELILWKFSCYDTTFDTASYSRGGIFAICIHTRVCKEHIWKRNRSTNLANRRSSTAIICSCDKHNKWIKTIPYPRYRFDVRSMTFFRTNPFQLNSIFSSSFFIGFRCLLLE